MMKYIIPAVSVVAVIALFILFTPAEPGLLYWFNFIWSVSCVGGVTYFMANTRSDGSGRMSSPVAITMIGYLVAYGVLLFVVMTAHFALVEPGAIWILTDFPSPYARMLAKLAPLFQENPELGQKIYFGVFIAITLVAVIVAYILLQADSGYLEREKVLSAETAKQRDYAAQMKLAALTYSTKCREQNVSFTGLAAGETPLSQIAAIFNSLTPNVMRNSAARPQLDELLDKAEEFAATQDVATTKECVVQWVESAKQTIRIIKEMSRS